MDQQALQKLHNLGMTANVALRMKPTLKSSFQNNFKFGEQKPDEKPSISQFGDVSQVVN